MRLGKKCMKVAFFSSHNYLYEKLPRISAQYGNAKGYISYSKQLLFYQELYQIRCPNDVTLSTMKCPIMYKNVILQSVTIH